MAQFFPRLPALHDSKQENKLSFINIGGKQFHALAVTLIDSLKSGSPLNDTALKVLLGRFFDYYPQFKSQQAYSTPADRMAKLISGVRKSDLVECMTHVLRQLAVDEIYAYPLIYREAYDGLDANTSKGYLRQATAPLPISALKTLSRSLGINIALSYIEHGKEFRRRKVYSAPVNSSKSLLTIQVQGEHFFPGVKNKADFAYVGQLAINPPVPVIMSSEQEGTIAEQVELIAADNKRLLQSYTQWRQNLLTMIDGNELTTAALMDLYIEYLPVKPGIVENVTEFFSKLTHAEDNPVSVASIKDSGKQMNELLASSVAALISIGEIKEDQLSDRLDTVSGSSQQRISLP